jgi:hypothetical protein
MTVSVLDPLDLNLNQILNMLLQVLASNPGSGPEGRLLYNSTTKKIQWHNGTTYVGPYFDTTRLDQITAPAASVSLSSQKITNLLDGTGPQDAVSKAQLDAATLGITNKHVASVVSLANQTLSGLPTTDSITLTDGQVTLLTAQTTPSQNGLWAVHSGAWTRPSFFATGSDAAGSYVFIEQGTIWNTTGWSISGGSPITIDTTAQTWTQFSGTGEITAGAGLSKTGNTLDVNVDNSSIEINADTLRVKALGIVNAMIANTTIDLTTKVTGLLPVLNGGTGASTAAGARTNIGAVGKFAADVTGDGSTTSFAVTHNLGTLDLSGAEVWEVSTGGEVIIEKIKTSTNVLTVNFGTAPAVAKVYRVVVSA